MKLHRKIRLSGNVFIHGNLNLNYSNFTHFIWPFSVTWGDRDSEGSGLCHPGDECAGHHSSFLLPAETRIPSSPHMDVVSQPPAAGSCYTHPITPTCMAHEDLEFHFLSLKRKVKERWPRKWKWAHWALGPPASDRLAGSFSW